MRPPRPVPAALSQAPFTLAEAAAAGLPRSALRTSAYSQVYRGVFAPASLELNTPLRMLAALKSVPGPAAICGLSAFELAGAALPLDVPAGGDIHILRFRGSSYRGQAGIRVHTTMREFKPIEHREVPGLLVTDLATSWLWAAFGGASVYQLTVLGDHVVRRASKLEAPGALRVGLDDAGLVCGLKAARSALHLIRAGTDSAMETHLRLLIVCAGLPEPAVNFPVRDDAGTVRAYLDLCYPQYRIDIEYDGDSHRTSRGQWRRDQDRTRALALRGWLTIRCNGSVIADPEPFLRDLQLTMKRRGWDGVTSDVHPTRLGLRLPTRVLRDTRFDTPA